MLPVINFHRGWRKQVSAKYKEKNMEFILNTISFGFSNTRIEQDQATHEAKQRVQKRGINADQNLTNLLKPEYPSSEQAFWGGYCCISNHLLCFPAHIYTRRAHYFRFFVLLPFF